MGKNFPCGTVFDEGRAGGGGGDHCQHLDKVEDGVHSDCTGGERRESGFVLVWWRTCTAEQSLDHRSTSACVRRTPALFSRAPGLTPPRLASPTACPDQMRPSAALHAITLDVLCRRARVRACTSQARRAHRSSFPLLGKELARPGDLANHRHTMRSVMRDPRAQARARKASLPSAISV
jgi:hypothetical protein